MDSGEMSVLVENLNIRRKAWIYYYLIYPLLSLIESGRSAVVCKVRSTDKVIKVFPSGYEHIAHDEANKAFAYKKRQGLNPTDIHLRNTILTPANTIKVIDVARFKQEEYDQHRKDPSPYGIF